MTVMTAIPVDTAPAPLLSRAEAAALVAIAARRVPPLWPLDTAIAVNPLAGFEDLPFDEATAKAAQIFGARQTLPIAAWRALLAAGRISADALRDAAIARLGGIERAFAPIGPDVSRLDLLMARLVDCPVDDPAPAPAAPGADATFIAKWCAAFCDRGQAASPMPLRHLGLYRAVLALAPHDAEYARLAGPAGLDLLHQVPRDPLEAIAEAIAVLDIPAHEAGARLADLVARLPGWAGHLRWRSEHADPEAQAGAPATVADLVALWLLLARAGALAQTGEAPQVVPDPAALAGHFGHSRDTLGASWSVVEDIAALAPAELGRMFMHAAETGYRDALVPTLACAAAAPPAPAPVPDAQLVFCIDVRSEPLRRAIEAEGAYETLGYAGFFGIPLARHAHDADARDRMLPVLLAPAHDIGEAPAPGREAEAAAIARAGAVARHVSSLFALAKHGLASAFATAEATGVIAGVAMATRTLAPGLAARLGARIFARGGDAFAPALDRHPANDKAPALTLAERAGYAALLFRMTGLGPVTARLVVLTGHGGEAVNNPYAAALDCGACGGHAGGFNARVLAAICNDPAVRAALAAEGIAIAAETVFIAGEHNTTTDAVTLFDTARVPASHAADLARLQAALARAGAANRAARAAALGRASADLVTGAQHWGEVRPEWALTGNAAFIVGPRWLTAGHDCAGRVFLHSYDHAHDPDGQVLAMILTAPMVVAQWIACQYLFSTIDPERYGAGDKVTHNPVGRIGVLQGNGGDLRVGLPRQSLFGDDGVPQHVPQRLLCIVHAPFDRVAKVVGAHDVLTRLFGKGWVQLVAIDPDTGKALRWASDSECDNSAEPSMETLS